MANVYTTIGIEVLNNCTLIYITAKNLGWKKSNYTYTLSYSVFVATGDILILYLLSS